jgi:hypothetical protein
VGGSGAGGGHEGTAALAVEYLCNATATANSALSYRVKLTNTGDGNLPLNGVSVRYYFTNEPEAPTVVELDYGAISAPYESLTMRAVSTCTAYGPKATANTVCATTLSNVDDLIPGSNLELQLRIHTQAYQTFDQSNDYSFDATKTMYAPWDHITVFRGDMLLAGVAP